MAVCRALAFALLLGFAPCSLAVAQTLSAARQPDPAAIDRPAVGELPAVDELPAFDELIEQLGHPRYVNRYAAQQRLSELGLAAFDKLLAATAAEDPEVAAASSRLLRTMTVRWPLPGDPPGVARLLEGYGAESETDRRNRVMQLGRLGTQGVAALCRVARFDASPRVSRDAALEALAPSGSRARSEPAGDLAIAEPRREAIGAAVASLNSQYGPSRRVAATWLAAFLLQDEDPPRAAAAWRAAIAAEQNLLDARRPYTDERLLTTLRWHGLRAQLRAGVTAGLLETVDALTAASPQQSESTLTTALEWMVEAGADEGVDLVLDARRDQLTTKRGLYLAAMIRAQQGRDEDAADLADQAFAMPPGEEEHRVRERRKLLDGRLFVGSWLALRGRSEWARREYAEAADQTPTLSVNGVYCRWVLASSLHDHQQNARAAAVLTEAVDAVEADDRSRGVYSNLHEDNDQMLPSPGSLAGKRDYYAAFAAKERGDGVEQVERLRSALDNEPGDADFIIALYRAANAQRDAELLAEAKRHVLRLAEELQEQIDDQPGSPQHYNHWAWLISNTEGDFAKAVRYSRKSLELSRGRNAGYLDTLGRCYYALGDLEQAVARQREAVSLDPHTMVLRRQLDLFERALAESRAGDAGPRPLAPPAESPEQSSEGASPDNESA